MTKTILFVDKDVDVSFFEPEIVDAIEDNQILLVDSQKSLQEILQTVDEEEEIELIFNASFKEASAMQLEDEDDEMMFYRKEAAVKKVLQIAKEQSRKIKTIIFIPPFSQSILVTSDSESVLEMQRIIDAKDVDCSLIFVERDHQSDYNWIKSFTNQFLSSKAENDDHFESMLSFLISDKEGLLSDVRILQSRKIPFEFSSSIAKIADVFYRNNAQEFENILLDYLMVQIEEMAQYFYDAVSEEDKFFFRRQIEQNLGNIINQSFLSEVALGNVEAVKFYLENRAKLLQFGFDVNARSYNGVGAVALACHANNSESAVLDELLKVPTANVNAVSHSRSGGETPLHIACRDRNLAAVKKLLTRADICSWAKDQRGNTALHLAFDDIIWARNCDFDILTTLISSIKDVGINEYNERGETILTLSCKDPGGIDFIKFIFKEREGIDVNMVEKYSGKSPFFIACENGCTDIVRYFVEERDDVDFAKVDFRYISAFIIVCVREDMEMLEIIWPRFARSIIDPNSVSLNVLLDNRDVKALQFVEAKIIANIEQFELQDLMTTLQNSLEFLANNCDNSSEEFAVMRQSLQNMQNAAEEIFTTTVNGLNRLAFQAVPSSEVEDASTELFVNDHENGGVENAKS